jgi:hypothetical protein
MPDQPPDRGRITSGLTSNALVASTLEFVRDELPKWRDDPERAVEDSEERLNAQLCKYLNVASRQTFPMVYFHHEEKQTGTRRVDFSALPSENQIIGSTFHTIYNPFVVIEGKRLPSPTPDREREYVTGGESKSGGIQRFKLGLHGAKHELVALIAYVQEGELRVWFKQINSWIRDLEGTHGPGDEAWSLGEQLAGFVEHAASSTAESSSLHPRSGDVVSPNFRIRHFWVRMTST